MQVSHDDFTSDAEQYQWFLDKCQPFEDTEHPVREHDNWRLQERYYIHNAGRTTSTKTVVEENLKRAASELSGTTPFLGLPDNPKAKALKSPAQLHQMSINRATALVSRLSKLVATCETSMPTWKRSLEKDEYMKTRDGLQKVRATKDVILDDLEDVRELPTDEQLHQGVMEKLNIIQQALLDHIGALTDVLKKH